MNPGSALAARVCSGCGAAVSDPAIFACPAARPGDDIDHLLEPPEPPGGPWPVGPDGVAADANPFVTYRALQWSYAVARAGGMTDGDYVELVERLDRAVAAVDGRGFRVTPLVEEKALARALGGGERTVLAKDETRNVSGSHKARHLVGLMIHLQVLDRLVATADRPAASDTAPRPVLAIASCGNAALGAAVVAAAAGRALEVFVPPTVQPSLGDRLVALGAHVRICHRRPGEVGDPCHLRYREAVAAGAVPFATQGPENGLTLEGGATLGYELADQLTATVTGGLDRLFVQIGGGALAASVMLGLRRAVACGRLPRLPRLVAVQSSGAAPLVRAFWRTAELATGRRAAELTASGRAVTGRAIDATLAELAVHRSRVMWPWEEVPASLAGGILDDETYDWRAVVDAVLRTGGTALSVTEEQLAEANRLVRAHTTVDADPTGSAGVAGLLALGDEPPGTDSGTDLVLLTGVTRS